jgi:hypothetical protein
MADSDLALVESCSLFWEDEATVFFLPMLPKKLRWRLADGVEVRVGVRAGRVGMVPWLLRASSFCFFNSRSSCFLARLSPTRSQSGYAQ